MTLAPRLCVLTDPQQLPQSDRFAHGLALAQQVPPNDTLVRKAQRKTGLDACHCEVCSPPGAGRLRCRAEAACGAHFVGGEGKTLVPAACGDAVTCEQPPGKVPVGWRLRAVWTDGAAGCSLTSRALGFSGSHTWTWWPLPDSCRGHLSIPRDPSRQKTGGGCPSWSGEAGEGGTRGRPPARAPCSGLLRTVSTLPGCGS